MNNKLVIIIGKKSALVFFCKKESADVIKLGILDEWMSRTRECILIIMIGAGFILQAETNGTVHVLEIRHMLQ